MKTIQTEKVPKAIGPYSQAIIAGDLVFCAGQVALDPSTQTLVSGGVKEQTEQVLKNLSEVLKASGASLSRVTMTNVYLRTMDDFSVMNEVYERVFGEHKPARATVAVAGLPKDALVEISCVASLSA